MVPQWRVRPGTVIALVFVGSAGVAALLFLADARQSGWDEPPTVPPADTAATGAPQEAASAPDARPLVETSPPATAIPTATPDERGDAPCYRDMILVEGDYCPFVAHRCDKKRKAVRAGEEPPCELFKNEVLCEGGLSAMRYCIDKYEYPNREGALPAVLVSFEDAERACAAEDKRVCTHREWTFACEGEAVRPYPTGLERGAGVCNWDAGVEARVAPTRGPNVAATMLAIDKRVAAGDRPACTSPFGVVDLAGNVAEWTVEPMNSRTSHPFASVVAGGAWGASSSTCRSLADDLPPPHRSATLGFRCCADAFGPASEAPARPHGRKGGGLRPVMPRVGLP